MNFNVYGIIIHIILAQTRFLVILWWITNKLVTWTEDSSRSRNIEIKPLACLLLKCLPRTRTARSNDGHARYFAEAPCFLAPQRWSSLAYRWRREHLSASRFTLGDVSRFVLGPHLPAPLKIATWSRQLTYVCLARHPANCSTALPKVFSTDLQVYQCIRTQKLT